MCANFPMELGLFLIFPSGRTCTNFPLVVGRVLTFSFVLKKDCSYQKKPIRGAFQTKNVTNCGKSP